MPLSRNDLYPLYKDCTIIYLITPVVPMATGRITRLTDTSITLKPIEYANNLEEELTVFKDPSIHTRLIPIETINLVVIPPQHIEKTNLANEQQAAGSNTDTIQIEEQRPSRTEGKNLNNKKS